MTSEILKCQFSPGKIVWNIGLILYFYVCLFMFFLELFLFFKKMKITEKTPQAAQNQSLEGQASVRIGLREGAYNLLLANKHGRSRI